METKHLYFLGFVAGMVLPLAQFIPFLLDHGLNVPLFFEQLWANRISSFFGWDVIVSIAVLLVFITAEGQRLTLFQRTLCHVLSVVVGGSAGLPLFLYFRAQAADA